MAFDSAEAYGRYMGRYSEPLAPLVTDLAGVLPGQRVLDVGCGPGALTAVLVRRLGPDSVAAVDPSEAFVASARDRLPGVDVRAAAAESLPFADDTFDAALASLVVHFMADPVAGLREMARVTRSGGVVAAAVWDHAGGGGPLSTFWRAVQDLDPTAPGDADRAGTRKGHLGELCTEAGLVGIRESSLSVRVAHPSVEEWWQPYTLGIGPAGDHVAGLDDEGRDALRARCAALLPPAPFETTATAWAVVARVPA